MTHTHMQVAFQKLLKNKEVNFLECLGHESVKLVRDMMIHMVLHTDMSKHFTSLQEFKVLAEQNQRSGALNPNLNPEPKP